MATDAWLSGSTASDGPTVAGDYDMLSITPFTTSWISIEGLLLARRSRSRV